MYYDFPSNKSQCKANSLSEKEKVLLFKVFQLVNVEK